MKPFNQSFKRNTLYLTGASVLENSFVLASYVLLTRIMDVPSFGRFSFFLSILTIYSMINTLGLREYLPAISSKRCVSGNVPPVDALAWAMFWSFLFAGLNLIFYGLGAYDKLNVKLGSLYIWLSIALVFISGTYCIFSIWIGYAGTRIYFWLSFIQEAIKIVSILVMIVLHSLTLNKLVFLWVGCYGLFFLVNLTVLILWIRSLRKPFEFDLKWRTDYTKALGYMLPSSGNMLVPRLFIFLTGAFYPPEITANVAVSVTLVSLFGVFLLPYQKAVLSSINIAKNNTDITQFAVVNIRRVLLLIAILAIAGGVFGRLLTVPVFGQKYVEVNDIFIFVLVCFALDWPKILPDVFLTIFGFVKTVTSLELIKMLGLFLTFVLFREHHLGTKFLWIGVFFLLLNCAKYFVMIRHLRNE